MVFIIATMIFVLIYPTFSSAMTGYASENEAFLLDRDANMIKIVDLKPLAYIIHDGSRLNLSDDTKVTWDIEDTG